jgi:biofilm PGA synthesis protein PgaD
MSHRELIIESPGLQRPLPRNLWKLVTALFWAAWFWIWLPLLTVVGWAFGINTVFDQFVTRWGYIELLRLLPYYLLVVGVTGVSLVGWSLLQYYRFRGVERRQPCPVVTRADIAKGLGLNEETTMPWAAARRMVAYHDENGRVSWVEIGDVPDASAPPSATVVALGTSIQSANRESAQAQGLPVEEVPQAPLAPAMKRIIATTPTTVDGRQIVAPLIVEPVDESQTREISSAAQHTTDDYEPSIDTLASPETISRFATNSDSNNNSRSGQENEASSENSHSDHDEEFAAPVAVNARTQVPPRRRKRSLAAAQARKRGHFAL